jgi:hypothetical protein
LLLVVVVVLLLLPHILVGVTVSLASGSLKRFHDVLQWCLPYGWV